MEQKGIWNILADSWTNLRVKPHEEVIAFSKTEILEPVLDIGCGNCRNLIPFLERGKKCVGIDFSEEMVMISEKFLKKRGYGAEVRVGGMTKLPFKDATIGTIICNGVLHAAEREGRMKALSEMKRVLKKDGKILLSVWHRYQRRFAKEVLLSPFKGFRFDAYVDWDYHGEKYRRFYHLYSKGELRKDLESIGLKVERLWVSRGNVWGVMGK
jgi:SAM-dependent methyltransferase